MHHWEETHLSARVARRNSTFGSVLITFSGALLYNYATRLKKVFKQKLLSRFAIFSKNSIPEVGPQECSKAHRPTAIFGSIVPEAGITDRDK